MSIECFICCTKDGKSYEEIMLDSFYFKLSDYPLIQLSYAYNCRCNLYAHNRCLKNILNCPTCRKLVNKPKLYVETFIEEYLYLEWIVKNPLKLKIFERCNIVMILFIIIINYFNEFKIIKITNIYILCLLIFFLLFGIYNLNLIDYIKKYYLYDNKLNKFY